MLALVFLFLPFSPSPDHTHILTSLMSVTVFLIPFKDHLLEEWGSLTAHWAPTQSSAPTDWLPFCTTGS